MTAKMLGISLLCLLSSTQSWDMRNSPQVEPCQPEVADQQIEPQVMRASRERTVTTGSTPAFSLTPEQWTSVRPVTMGNSTDDFSHLRLKKGFQLYEYSGYAKHTKVLFVKRGYQLSVFDQDTCSLFIEPIDTCDKAVEFARLLIDGYQHQVIASSSVYARIAHGCTENTPDWVILGIPPFYGLTAYQYPGRSNVFLVQGLLSMDYQIVALEHMISERGRVRKTKDILCISAIESAFDRLQNASSLTRNQLAYNEIILTSVWSGDSSPKQNGDTYNGENLLMVNKSQDLSTIEHPYKGVTDRHPDRYLKNVAPLIVGNSTDDLTHLRLKAGVTLAKVTTASSETLLVNRGEYYTRLSDAPLTSVFEHIDNPAKAAELVKLIMNDSKTHIIASSTVYNEIVAECVKVSPKWVIASQAPFYGMTSSIYSGQSNVYVVRTLINRNCQIVAVTYTVDEHGNLSTGKTVVCIDAREPDSVCRRLHGTINNREWGDDRLRGIVDHVIGRMQKTVIHGSNDNVGPD